MDKHVRVWTPTTGTLAEVDLSDEGLGEAYHGVVMDFNKDTQEVKIAYTHLEPPGSKLPEGWTKKMNYGKLAGFLPPPGSGMRKAYSVTQAIAIHREYHGTTNNPLVEWVKLDLVRPAPPATPPAWFGKPNVGDFVDVWDGEYGWWESEIVEVFEEGQVKVNTPNFAQPLSLRPCVSPIRSLTLGTSVLARAGVLRGRCEVLYEGEKGPPPNLQIREPDWAFAFTLHADHAKDRGQRPGTI